MKKQNKNIRKNKSKEEKEWSWEGRPDQGYRSTFRKYIKTLRK